RYLERALRAVWRKWCRSVTAAAADTYSLGSDSDYLAKLRDLVERESVTMEVSDLRRLRDMDSPVAFQAETEQWAWALIIPAGLVWWQFDFIAAAAVSAAWIVIYATFGRWLIRRRTAARVHKAMWDVATWRNLWRHGGIRLVGRGPESTELRANAPGDS